MDNVMNSYEDLTVSELDDLLDAQGMSKDGLKQDKINRLMDAEIPEQETPEAGRDKPEVDKTYEVRMWAGKIPVYVCEHCGMQRDDEETIILHVVKHFPESKRQAVFNRLVKELENG